MITQPMLADGLFGKKEVFSLQLFKEKLARLRYPLLATPKYDGIRCFMNNGTRTRSFKPIPNLHIRKTLETHIPNGIDGELIIPNADYFGKVTSPITTREGQPEFEYHIFDWVYEDLNEPYQSRIERLLEVHEYSFLWLPFIKVVEAKLINSPAELLAYEEECVQQGFEGCIVRSPLSPYKLGRSTLNQGYLVKIKRFSEGEARIIGFEEKMHNANTLKQDAYGYAERSSHKANKIPLNTLGALIVVDLETGIEFSLPGFTAEFAKKVWENKEFYLNKVAKYKYQMSGAKDLPRFPSFLSIRDETDMGGEI